MREALRDAGLTQEEVANRLGKPQSYISKSFTGNRRLDIVEIRAISDSLGLSLTQFIANYEKYLAKHTRSRRPK